MRIAKTLVSVSFLVVVAFACTSCKKEMTIQCHSDTTDLRVDGKKIGDLYIGDTEDVEVPALGSFLIKWTNYDGGAESQTMTGESVEDGAVWHLYYGYGSFDEW